MLELQETGIGKVRIFDAAGKRITPEELTSMVDAPSGSEEQATS